MAAGRLARPDKQQKRALQRAFRKQDGSRRREDDEALLSQAGIRKLRENPLFQTPRHDPDGRPPPPLGHVHNARPCYVCRAPITEVHGFYDQMCIACGDLNFAKRHQTADLRGRVALLTGGRVKIGFQAGVMLLRAGCRVVVTTRFPNDAAARYAALDDFADFADRLEIVGIDLRQIGAVEGLAADLLERLPKLDYLVNNACQTVRRPPGFYDHLLEAERAPPALPGDVRSLVIPAPHRDAALSSAELTQVRLLPEDHAPHHLFPTGRFDADAQQVDLREVNSWRLEMAEVSTIELLEVHLVNAVAPFVLNARLKPLMAAVPTQDAHIVNVSAMEGQFYRVFKTSKHPHTNMAKASLNMMTRTASLDYVRSGIHMNSVDTGWVTDEDPVAHAERKREEMGFHPPLDIVDGAARIIDPIFHGVNTGDHVWGQFLKDYRITDW
ncbi:MAG: SDR family oxidoreductase [Alphaproteobacteria bacterium]|nr:SDR family oxidoreductase [Alphaproteobacteria bacterium]